MVNGKSFGEWKCTELLQLSSLQALNLIIIDKRKIKTTFQSMTEELNKQFPIQSKNSLFQNEANCKTFVVKMSQFPRMIWYQWLRT